VSPPPQHSLLDIQKAPPTTTNSLTLKKATAMLAETSENLQSAKKSNPESLSNACYKRKCFLNWYFSHQICTKLLIGCTLVPRIRDYSELSHIQMAQENTVELSVPHETAEPPCELTLHK
jgi:hypothetical protein